MNTKTQLTGDVQRKRESWNVSGERNFETFRGQERLEYVAHDIYLMFLVSLELLPNDRVVEHVEFVRTELAEHFKRLTMIDHKDLAI